MRLRRKKHLDERLAQCSDILLVIAGDDIYKTTDISTIEKINYQQTFNNDKGVVLELGCGRATFAMELAKRGEKNVIAVEKISNVIVDACEHALEINAQNLKFMNCSAEQLSLFIEPHTVEAIYLNFSCPYPKNSYANRRMTSDKFLQLYKKLLVKNGLIIQKTDNRPFFDYSLVQFEEAGYTTLEVSYDLYNSPFIKGNIATEYEQKFVSLGEKINYVKVQVPAE